MSDENGDTKSHQTITNFRLNVLEKTVSEIERKLNKWAYLFVGIIIATILAAGGDLSGVIKIILAAL